MDKSDLFSNRLNMLEHTLGIYAKGFATIQAALIYDDTIINEIKNVTDNSHIYIIGEQPKIEIIRSFSEKGYFCIEINVYSRDDADIIKLPIPDGYTFYTCDSYNCIRNNDNGKIIRPSLDDILNNFARQIEPIPFYIKYIGQAYGANGKRNVIDRLKKHEKLQQISLTEKDDDKDLQIITLELAEHQLISHINPFAQDTGKNTFDNRVNMGLDKLNNTLESELVTLYEAAFIRYFQPKYNKHFKNNFPSTNIRILQDCYKKDFQSLVAEISFDNFFYSLYSDFIPLDNEQNYIAHYDLHHDSEERRSFFQIN